MVVPVKTQQSDGISTSWRSLGKFQKCLAQHGTSCNPSFSTFLTNASSLTKNFLSTSKFCMKQNCPPFKTKELNGHIRQIVDHRCFPKSIWVSLLPGSAVTPMFSCLNQNSPSSELLGLLGMKTFWPSKSCGD